MDISGQFPVVRLIGHVIWISHISSIVYRDLPSDHKFTLMGKNQSFQFYFQKSSRKFVFSPLETETKIKILDQVKN